MAKDIERISDADCLLVQRSEAAIAAHISAANAVQSFVSSHIAATYKLGQGDKIEDDGTIVRLPPPPGMEPSHFAS